MSIDSLKFDISISNAFRGLRDSPDQDHPLQDAIEDTYWAWSAGDPEVPRQLDSDQIQDWLFGRAVTRMLDEERVNAGLATTVVSEIVEIVETLPELSLTTTYALYAVPAVNPVTETVLALAVAEEVPFTTVGALAPWLITVEESGADDAEA